MTAKEALFVEMGWAEDAKDAPGQMPLPGFPQTWGQKSKGKKKGMGAATGGNGGNGIGGIGGSPSGSSLAGSPQGELEAHDKKNHPNGYKGGRCKLRGELAAKGFDVRGYDAKVHNFTAPEGYDYNVDERNGDGEEKSGEGKIANGEQVGEEQKPEEGEKTLQEPEKVDIGGTEITAMTEDGKKIADILARLDKEPEKVISEHEEFSGLNPDEVKEKLQEALKKLSENPATNADAKTQAQQQAALQEQAQAQQAQHEQAIAAGNELNAEVSSEAGQLDLLAKNHEQAVADIAQQIKALNGKEPETTALKNELVKENKKFEKEFQKIDPVAQNEDGTPESPDDHAKHCKANPKSNCPFLKGAMTPEQLQQLDAQSAQEAQQVGAEGGQVVPAEGKVVPQGEGPNSQEGAGEGNAQGEQGGGEGDFSHLKGAVTDEQYEQVKKSPQWEQFRKMLVDYLSKGGDVDVSDTTKFPKDGIFMRTFNEVVAGLKFQGRKVEEWSENDVADVPANGSFDNPDEQKNQEQIGNQEQLTDKKSDFQNLGENPLGVEQGGEGDADDLDFDDDGDVEPEPPPPTDGTPSPEQGVGQEPPNGQQPQQPFVDNGRRPGLMHKRDWTPAQRAALQELAKRFGAAAEGFRNGVSDEKFNQLLNNISNFTNVRNKWTTTPNVSEHRQGVRDAITGMMDKHVDKSYTDIMYDEMETLRQSDKIPTRCKAALADLQQRLRDPYNTSADKQRIYNQYDALARKYGLDDILKNGGKSDGSDIVDGYLEDGDENHKNGGVVSSADEYPEWDAKLDNLSGQEDTNGKVNNPDEIKDKIINDLSAHKFPISPDDITETNNISTTDFTFKFPKDRKVTKGLISALKQEIARNFPLDENKGLSINYNERNDTLVVTVENDVKGNISQKTLLKSPEFQAAIERGDIPIALGIDEKGKPIIGNLTDYVHVLLAGQTGAGKSARLGSIVSSLLAQSPDNVRLMVVDPKRVEFSFLKGDPHLIGDVVTESSDAVDRLKYLVNEQENRYRLFEKAGVRNLKEYNDLVKQGKLPEGLPKKLPAISLVIDEFGDLMDTNGKDIEKLVKRLGQKSRAAGVHLVLATQRPTADSIPTSLRANLPTTIGMNVKNAAEARYVGIEGLEGLPQKGPLLIKTPDGKTTRVDGSYIDLNGLETIVKNGKGNPKSGPTEGGEGSPSGAEGAEGAAPAGETAAPTQSPDQIIDGLAKTPKGKAGLKAIADRLTQGNMKPITVGEKVADMTKKLLDGMGYGYTEMKGADGKVTITPKPKEQTSGISTQGSESSSVTLEQYLNHQNSSPSSGNQREHLAKGREIWKAFSKEHNKSVSIPNFSDKSDSVPSMKPEDIQNITTEVEGLANELAKINKDIKSRPNYDPEEPKLNQVSPEEKAKIEALQKKLFEKQQAYNEAKYPSSDRQKAIASFLVDNALCDIPTQKGDSLVKIGEAGGRDMVVLNINGHRIPFYRSTGLGGKIDVESGKWYPFLGMAERGVWLNKTSGSDIASYYESPQLREIANALDKKYPVTNDRKNVPPLDRNAVTAEINSTLPALPSDSEDQSDVNDITSKNRDYIKSVADGISKGTIPEIQSAAESTEKATGNNEKVSAAPDGTTIANAPESDAGGTAEPGGEGDANAERNSIDESLRDEYDAYHKDFEETVAKARKTLEQKKAQGKAKSTDYANAHAEEQAAIGTLNLWREQNGLPKVTGFDKNGKPVFEKPAETAEPAPEEASGAEAQGTEPAGEEEPSTETPAEPEENPYLDSAELDGMSEGYDKDELQDNAAELHEAQKQYEQSKQGSAERRKARDNIRKILKRDNAIRARLGMNQRGDNGHIVKPAEQGSAAKTDEAKATAQAPAENPYLDKAEIDGVDDEFNKADLEDGARRLNNAMNQWREARKSDPDSDETQQAREAFSAALEKDNALRKELGLPERDKNGKLPQAQNATAQEPEKKAEPAPAAPQEKKTPAKPDGTEPPADDNPTDGGDDDNSPPDDGGGDDGGADDGSRGGGAGGSTGGATKEPAPAAEPEKPVAKVEPPAREPKTPTDEEVNAKVNSDANIKALEKQVQSAKTTKDKRAAQSRLNQAKKSLGAAIRTAATKESGVRDVRTKKPAPQKPAKTTTTTTKEKVQAKPEPKPIASKEPEKKQAATNKPEKKAAPSTTSMPSKEPPKATKEGTSEASKVNKPEKKPAKKPIQKPEAKQETPKKEAAAKPASTTSAATTTGKEPPKTRTEQKAAAKAPAKSRSDNIKTAAEIYARNMNLPNAAQHPMNVNMANELVTAIEKKDPKVLLSKLGQGNEMSREAFEKITGTKLPYSPKELKKVIENYCGSEIGSEKPAQKPQAQGAKPAESPKKETPAQAPAAKKTEEGEKKSDNNGMTPEYADYLKRKEEREKAEAEKQAKIKAEREARLRQAQMGHRDNSRGLNNQSQQFEVEAMKKTDPTKSENFKAISELKPPEKIDNESANALNEQFDKVSAEIAKLEGELKRNEEEGTLKPAEIQERVGMIGHLRQGLSDVFTKRKLGQGNFTFAKKVDGSGNINGLRISSYKGADGKMSAVKPIEKKAATTAATSQKSASQKQGTDTKKEEKSTSAKPAPKATQQEISFGDEGDKRGKEQQSIRDRVAALRNKRNKMGATAKDEAIAEDGGIWIPVLDEETDGTAAWTEIFDAAMFSMGGLRDDN